MKLNFSLLKKTSQFLAAFFLISVYQNCSVENFSSILSSNNPNSLNNSSSSSPSEPSNNRILSFQLGVNGHPFEQAAYNPTGINIQTQMDLVQKLNAKWYRVGLNSFDQTLAAAKLKGIQLLPLISYAPGTLATDTDEQVQANAYTYAFNTVSKYKNDIHIWELTNEQDIQALLKMGDPTPKEYLSNGCNLSGIWNCGATGGINIYDYNNTRYSRIKALLLGLSQGIHDADPTAKRMINFGGWTHIGFVQRIEDDHIPYEILSIHWYSGQGEMTCPGEQFPCPSKPKYFNVIEKVQQITGNKPMWMTETNYIYNMSSLSEQADGQSSYLQTVLSRYLSDPKKYPFEVVFVYELLDEPAFEPSTEAHYGLYSVIKDASGTRLGVAKPAYDMLANLFNNTSRAQ